MRERLHCQVGGKFHEIHLAAGIPDHHLAIPCMFTDSPSVGDSGGTLGRRTCSAGECSKISSITQVR
jgi:hypothetical protein